ncbi:hypothetical protein AsAng_0002530 [Aureispira anguillae]|uniref:Uncharacterized protein n=1 Tax=Aureispira anguillae TaxID=2864201 RepID=A0A915VK79_9BACT|nr:hypothetical protein AsAng_0002530 [Aureispira anguillae]
MPALIELAIITKLNLHYTSLFLYIVRELNEYVDFILFKFILKWFTFHIINLFDSFFLILK